MMTTLVVSSVSGRSASQRAPDEPALADVISQSMFHSRSFQVNVGVKEEDISGWMWLRSLSPVSNIVKRGPCGLQLTADKKYCIDNFYPQQSPRS